MIGCPDNDITAHGSLLIRRAVLRDDWISDTLLDLAAAGRIKWTLAEWEVLLAEMATSKLTVGEWLTLYT